MVVFHHPIVVVARALLVSLAMCECGIVKHMKYGYAVALCLIACLSAVAILHVTSPSSAGPLMVLVFFICIYAASASALYMIMLGLRMLGMRLLPEGVHRRTLEELRPLKLYYYASVAGLVPVILLGMQSIGGARVWDIVLLFLFVGLGWFYIAKRF